MLHPSLIALLHNLSYSTSSFHATSVPAWSFCLSLPFVFYCGNHQVCAAAARLCLLAHSGDRHFISALLNELAVGVCFNMSECERRGYEGRGFVCGGGGGGVLRGAFTAGLLLHLLLLHTLRQR